MPFSPNNQNYGHKALLKLGQSHDLLTLFEKTGETKRNGARPPTFGVASGRAHLVVHVKGALSEDGPARARTLIVLVLATRFISCSCLLVRTWLVRTWAKISIDSCQFRQWTLTNEAKRAVRGLLGSMGPVICDV